MVTTGSGHSPKPHSTWQQSLGKLAIITAVIPAGAGVAAVVARLAGAGPDLKTGLVLIAYFGTLLPATLGPVAATASTWNDDRRAEGCLAAFLIVVACVGWIVALSLLAVLFIGTDIEINS